MFHIVLHFVMPAIVAATCFRRDWKKAFVIMLATMAIDLDHLLADPMYDPNRCSVGFHPLHKLWLIPMYIALSVHDKTKYVGLGLVIHLFLDWTDCLSMND